MKPRLTVKILKDKIGMARIHMDNAKTSMMCATVRFHDAEYEYNYLRKRLKTMRSKRKNNGKTY